MDLRNLAGEATGTATYWQAAREAIDEVIDHKLTPAVGREDVRHLSVFAFARLPLLVYLGSKLDDTFEVAIYQRHRTRESWDWSDGQPVTFAVEASGDPAEDALLQMNVSGAIDVAEIPVGLVDLPRYVLSPIDANPDKDLIASRETLAAFAAEVRRFFSSLEVPVKTVRRLHVLAALPLSASVTLGRIHHSGVNPSLVLYDRADGQYVPILEIA
ncbi:MAG: SAVED domain-containing protein [Chloroflexota bacterium]|nr:SAVED domain-containing protein [Chloroflexota bacterium]